MTSAALPLPTTPERTGGVRLRTAVDPVVLLAAALTIVLTLAWAAKAWPALSILRLPDNDDMMRLTQVRDWLGGQAFDDLSQHRLGPPGGASMHWSRIADLLAAALVLAFRPFLGAHGAEVAMVVTHPAILFFFYLLLLARIARRLGGEGARVPAVVLGALAFPTIGLFVPGRIDHHALQIVLSLVVLDAVVAPAALVAGLVGGLAAALSLAIGLETAPETVAVIAVLGLLWVAGGADEDRRLAGFGAALGLATLALLALERPAVWPERWCDGFTPQATRATLVLAGALAALGVAGPQLRGRAVRFGAAAAAGLAVGVAALTVSPVCFRGPYGALDPYLDHVWMSQVAEARGLFFSEPPVTAISYGGLCFASLGALAVLLRDPARRARWWPIGVFILLGAVIAVAQLRVTYIMGGVSTLPFAALLARREGARLGRRLLVWVAGCGVVWSQAAGAIGEARQTRAEATERRLGRACSDGRVLRRLAALPPGVVMVPLDTAAYVVGMTPHRSMAAPYHRNNVGNLAMYRFFLSPPDRAERIARAWRVDYVVTCPTSLDEPTVAAQRRGSLVEALTNGRPPAWLRPVTRDPADMMIYRTR